MKMKLLLLGCGLSLGVASSGYAATTTGSIAAKLILTAVSYTHLTLPTTERV